MRRVLTTRLRDRLAGWLIRLGGILVILLVVGMVVNIALESLPLFRGARWGAPVAVVSAAAPAAVGAAPATGVVWWLARSGAVNAWQDGRVSEIARIGSGAAVVAVDHEVDGVLSVLDADGSVRVGRLRVVERWSEDGQRLDVGWRPLAPALATGAAHWARVTANADVDGNLVAAVWNGSGRLGAARWSAVAESWSPLPDLEIAGVTAVAVAPGTARLAAVDGDGTLRVWETEGMVVREVRGIRAPVEAVRFLIGGGTLVAAGRDGSVQVLLEVPRVAVTNLSAGELRVAGTRLGPEETAVLPDDDIAFRYGFSPDLRIDRAEPVWQVVRSLPAMPARPTVIAPSHRGRSFLVGDASGFVGLYHGTSGRRLTLAAWAESPVNVLAMAPRGNGAVMSAAGDVVARGLDSPHPEISLRTLFLPVWYEGYAAPRHVWQTTGGSDADEPKLGLWPLVFGTLKATLYSMAVSIPLALLSALYVSQLAPAWLQSFVKPTVELMAAVPSVVVGFLAALWLAPRLQAWLFEALLGVAAVPFSVVLALAAWRLMSEGARRAMPRGAELVLLLASLVLVLAAAVQSAGILEAWLFDGDFERYLFTEWGVRYDQRNSLVIGIALGFAVVPVIFTIAEDACSGVPRSLVQAARALGATRWQAAVRLVVPAAIPGLFAAVMLGIGRAVGETMIVLMAAGNTPILDLTPFKGMRTISAAIAFEIPEAAVGGTLFRVLFLAGLLLFGLSFVFTMAAEMVGRRLRRRYARL